MKKFKSMDINSRNIIKIGSLLDSDICEILNRIEMLLEKE